MVDADAIAAVVYRLVESSPKQQVLGSALAVLLKRAYPDFKPEDFGCRNLRDFVRAYAKEVYELDRSGTDIVYSISRIPAPQDATQTRRELLELRYVKHSSLSQLNRRVWKTFVSPSAPFNIFADRNQGILEVLPAGQAPRSEDWTKIPPSPPEVHEQIAREFINTLPDGDAKSQLTKVLGLDQAWWEHFFVSARNLGLEKQWSAYRRKRLHDEFEKTLEKLGITLRKQPAAVSVSAQEPEDQLRRIAIGILGRMNASELRELRLPLGYVVDELKSK